MQVAPLLATVGLKPATQEEPEQFWLSGVEKLYAPEIA